MNKYKISCLIALCLVGILSFATVSQFGSVLLSVAVAVLFAVILLMYACICVNDSESE